MSLSRQLWIACILVMLLSFSGSFIVSTLLAKNYLVEQLRLKNIDNATSLALSMTQMPKDPVMVELMISAQFDSGHYEYIRLIDPLGNLIVERIHDGEGKLPPHWFTRMIDLTIEPGIAQVQDGWHQFGTLSLKSHSQFAYQSLWQGTIRLALWFVGGIVVTGLVGTLLLRWVIRPLYGVVKQAEAIGDRRFITIKEPRTRELRTLVSSMNALSQRVSSMLSEETQRLEQLRLTTQHDAVTGLLNRDEFIKRAGDLLRREDKSAAGVLVVTRVLNLAEINREQGREITDRLLQQVAVQLTHLTAGQEDWSLARLGGSEFALLAPTEDDMASLADQVAGRVAEGINSPAKAGEPVAATGATRFVPGEELAELLSRMDNALAAAEQQGTGAPVTIERKQTGRQLATSIEGWRTLIDGALTSQQLKLAQFPVVDTNNQLIHSEVPLRMQLGGEWQPAGVFMPWAARLGILPLVDAHTLRLALDHIAIHHQPIGINLSAEALADNSFRAELVQLLQQAPLSAPHLWIEIPESGAYRHLEEFRSLCLSLKPLGCKIGIEHVGHQFSRMAALYDLGLDYIKIDSPIIRDIDRHQGSQALVRGLCLIAHSIGLLIIAEGVSSEAERLLLPTLGIDGMTGPAIQQ